MPSLLVCLSLLFFCSPVFSKNISIVLIGQAAPAENHALIQNDVEQLVGHHASGIVDASQFKTQPGMFYLSANDFRFWSQRTNGILARYLRAFRERGMRSAVFWIFPDQSWDEQKTALADILAQLRRRGFIVAQELPKPVAVEPAWVLWLKRLGAFLIVLAVPLAATFKKDLLPVLTAFTLSLVTGVLAWLILQSDVFRFQMAPLYFVQTAFLAPFILIFGLRLGQGRQSLGLAALGLLLACVVLERLGGRWPVSHTEYAVRDWFDVVVGIRPRAKEIFGWFFWHLLERQRPDVQNRWLIFAVFGPVSTLNSFLHIHAPWAYILERSLLAFVVSYFLAKFFLKMKVYRDA